MAKKYPHYYYVTDVAFCSPSALFDTFRQPGRSAPGAPSAKDDTTQDISLSGVNPITHVVSPSTMTIINITQKGHYFHSGTVTIKISPSIVGSRYEITGRGYNSSWVRAQQNEIAGYAFFGAVGVLNAKQCNFGGK